VHLHTVLQALHGMQRHTKSAALAAVYTLACDATPYTANTRLYTNSFNIHCGSNTKTGQPIIRLCHTSCLAGNNGCCLNYVHSALSADVAWQLQHMLVDAETADCRQKLQLQTHFIRLLLLHQPAICQPAHAGCSSPSTNSTNATCWLTACRRMCICTCHATTVVKSSTQTCCVNQQEHSHTKS
jgi:hypothetical protein